MTFIVLEEMLLLPIAAVQWVNLTADGLTMTIKYYNKVFRANFFRQSM